MQKQLSITVIAGLTLMTAAMAQEPSDQTDTAAQENAERALRILQEALALRGQTMHP